jgi:molecular chaperone GrpE (heat shock protein)
LYIFHLKPSSITQVALFVNSCRLRLAEFKLNAEKEQSETAIKILGNFYTEIGQILNGNGVVEFRDVGKVNPKRHHVDSAIPVNNIEKNGDIAETLLLGYTVKEKILRPQLVVVYVKED